MIHILLGDDLKNKSLYIKDLVQKKEVFFVSGSDLNKELILNYSNNISLFNESPAILIENILNEETVIFLTEELVSLGDSQTIFIFKEDKMSVLLQKKYKKYGEIKTFENKKTPTVLKFNVFSITDAFANRDKISTWILYWNAINSSIEPEAIAGILFWKIKTMLLNSTKVFSQKELKQQSSLIIYLYHKAHRGETDFIVALEQFILLALSSH